MDRTIILNETGTTLDTEAQKFSAGTFSLYNNVGTKLVSGVDIADASPDFVVSSDGALKFDLLKTQQILVKDVSGNIKFNDIMLGDDYDPVTQKETTDSLYNSLITNGILSDSLWQYDDININPIIKPFVKQCHFMYEKHFKNNGNIATWKYDESIPQVDYLREANGSFYYLYLLVKLYKTTKNQVYATRAVKLYNDLIDDFGFTEAKVGDATKTCWTFNLYPDITWDHWAHTEYLFNLAGLHLWEELGDTYIYMKDNALNWADVVYSYRTEPDASSMVWWYFWNGTYNASNDRLNASVPQMVFYAYMLSKGYTTPDLSLSTLSTAVDKIYNHCFTKNWQEEGIDPLTNMGGWTTLLTEVLPSETDPNYSRLIMNQLAEISEMDGFNVTWGTTWKADAFDKWQKVLNWYCSTSAGILGGGARLIQETNVGHAYFVIIGTESHGFTGLAGMENHVANTKAMWFHKNPLNKEYGVQVQLIKSPRNYHLGIFFQAGDMLHFNDQNLNYPFTSALITAPNLSKLQFADGWSIKNSYYIAPEGDFYDATSGIGFRTDDATPNETTVLSGNMSVTTYPVQTNTRSYTLRHMLGTSYWDLESSGVDEIFLYGPGTGDALYNSYYFAYYDLADALQVVLLNSFATIITDKFSYKPYKGCMLYSVGGSTGYYASNIVFSEGLTGEIYLDTIDPAYTLFKSTETYKKIFLAQHDWLYTPYLEGTYPSYDFTYHNEAIKDALKIAGEQFGKGLAWRGHFQ